MPGFQLFPNQASTIAQQTDILFFVLLGVSLLVVLFIGGAIVTFVVKYRRRSELELPPQIEGSGRLELAWTLIPFFGFMLFFVLGARVYLIEASPPSNSEDVYVVGKQWMWKFQHAGGQSEINELHVPVGRPIRLTMTSQDVIHSFFVPDFRIKQDVLPDRYTTTWFQATQVGKYQIFCSQYCGTGHATMLGSVIVMSPAEYGQWLAGGSTGAQSPAAAGQALFQQYGCSGCHREDGHGPGPVLAGVFGSTVQLEGGRSIVADSNYIRESILNPSAKVVKGFQPLMPSFQGRLNEEQIVQLIAYLRSLGSNPGSAPAPTGVPAGPP